MNRHTWDIGGWAFIGLMIVAMILVAVSIAGHMPQFFGAL